MLSNEFHDECQMNFTIDYLTMCFMMSFMFNYFTMYFELSNKFYDDFAMCFEKNKKIYSSLRYTVNRSMNIMTLFLFFFFVYFYWCNKIKNII